MGRIKKLLDREFVGGSTDEEVYPISSTKAIYDPSNTSLDFILKDYLDKINKLSSKVGFYVCDSLSSDPDKEIQVPNFSLDTNIRLIVKMTRANSADNVSFEVNDTGAKLLYYNDELASSQNTWKEGETVDIYYDGTVYRAFHYKFDIGELTDSLWTLKEDESGVKYLYTDLNIVVRGGGTFYSSGDNPLVPSIFDNIPIDNDTIYWYTDPETKERYLKAKGGSGEGGEGDTGLWKLVEDENGNKYVVTEYNVVGRGGITAYYDGELTPGGPGLGGGSVANIEILGEGNAIVDVALNEDKSIINFTKGVLVDLPSDQTIEGLKTFVNGIKIGDHLINIVDGVLFLDCSIAVTGGITQYATGDRVVSTIMDGVVVDGTTISKEGGVLKVIGGAGGDLNLTKMWAALAGNTNEQINKTHLTDALNGYATETWVNSNFPTKTGSGASGTWGIDITGSSADSDKLDGYHASGLLTSMSSSRTTNLSVTVGGHTETLSTMHVDYAWQLENTRKIWGQNFNGTADVSGGLSGVDGIEFSFDGSFNVDNKGNLYATKNDSSYYWNIKTYTGNVALSVNAATGNVGIGMENPSKKLVVVGDILIKGNIIAEGGITQYSTGESGGSGGTTVSLWGQEFDGTNDVSGALSSVGGINFNGYGHFRLDGNGNLIATVNSDSYFWSVVKANGVPALTVKAQTGLVGIGTTSPAYTLHVNGTTKLGGDIYFKSDGFKFDQYGNIVALINSESYHWNVQRYGGIVSLCVKASSGNVGINNDSPTEKLHVSGNIYATGTVNWSSDGRAKNILEKLSIPLLNIANSPTVRFEWNGWNKQKGDGKTHIGGIAQYIQQILPEAVINTNGMLAMDYGVTGYIFAVNTAKHLLNYETKTDKEINKLKKRVKYLEKQLKKLGYEEANIVDN